MRALNRLTRWLFNKNDYQNISLKKELEFEKGAEKGANVRGAVV